MFLIRQLTRRLHGRGRARRQAVQAQPIHATAETRLKVREELQGQSGSATSWRQDSSVRAATGIGGGSGGCVSLYQGTRRGRLLSHPLQAHDQTAAERTPQVPWGRLCQPVARHAMSDQASWRCFWNCYWGFYGYSTPFVMRAVSVQHSWTSRDKFRASGSFPSSWTIWTERP